MIEIIVPSAAMPPLGEAEERQRLRANYQARRRRLVLSTPRLTVAQERVTAAASELAHLKKIARGAQREALCAVMATQTMRDCTRKARNARRRQRKYATLLEETCAERLGEPPSPPVAWNPAQLVRRITSVIEDMTSSLA